MRHFATTLRVNLTKRCSGERRETVARTSHDYRASILNYSQLCRQMLKEFLLSEMIVSSSARSWLGILKYILLANSSFQVFLLSERIVSYKYGVLIRLTYMYCLE